MNKLFLFIACLMSLCAVVAQDKSPLMQMIEAEKSFSAYANSSSVQEAFMKYLDDSAVVFERGNILNGKDVWKDRKTNNLGLKWYPEFAEVASSGDLGYTTGPWQLRTDKSKQQPDETGYFNSVWKKDANSDWKVVADIGTASKQAVYDENKVDYINTGAMPVSTGKKGANLKKTDTTEARNIQDIEEEFIANYARGKGYMKSASEKARFIRPGKPVLRTSQTMGDTTKYVYRYGGGEVASSSDMAYAYGFLDVSGKKGNYLRVWKREGEEWKIVLDVASY